MSTITKQSVAHKLELGVIYHLKKSGAFRGCALIAKGDATEAPEKLPCIVVHCQQVRRMDDTPYQMYAKDGNMVCVLYGDSEDMKEAKYQSYARELECRMEDLTGMQGQFNKPDDRRDTRKVRGLHLHYIDEFQTDSDTDGTMWEFGVGCTLMIEEVDS